MDSRNIECYSKDAAVFREGDTASCLYILRSGAVELTKKGERGQILLRTITAKNDFFGEMALVDGLPRSATATAITETTLARVDSASFDFMLSQRKFSAKIVRILVERIRRANIHLAEIVDLRVKTRLARAVVDFALRYGDSGSLDAKYVEIDRLSKWLYGHLGLAPEIIDFELNSLIDEGSLVHAKIAQSSDEYLLVTGSLSGRTIAGWRKLAGILPAFWPEFRLSPRPPFAFPAATLWREAIARAMSASSVSARPYFKKGNSATKCISSSTERWS